MNNFQYSTIFKNKIDIFVLYQWYLSQLLVQSNYTRSYMFMIKVHSALSILLYGKVTKLTSYSTKSLNIGKLKNLIQSDLAVIDIDVATCLNCISLPFEVIGLSTLLIIRLGWPGAVGVAILIASFAFISCFSQFYSAILE